MRVIDPHRYFHFEDVQSQDDFVTAKWHVPGDLPYLQGHFPGQPIVPAVAILDATTELLSQALRAKFEISQVKNSKFTKPVEPNQTVFIECLRVIDHEWTIDWKIDGATPGELVARLLIVTQ